MTGELRKPNPPRQANITTPSAVPPAANANVRVQPEQMSLNAHRHIKTYLNNRNSLNKEDVTAVLRLSQHLRVFGLLSAVGYINQVNAQEGRIRERTVPVWESLLGQLIADLSGAQNPLTRQQLKVRMVEMAEREPAQYMVSWRKALILANYWNFWARAYQEQ